MQASPKQQTLSRPPGLPETAPVAEPISDRDLRTLVDWVSSCRRLVVLTGAGCSTESDIPDYRGPKGAYSSGFQPMTHQQFMATPQRRARYWARSFAGWHEFREVQPNRAHDALARLQRNGWVSALLTQNVDRLHHKAGSRGVIELHGTTHRVICMSCGDITHRDSLQARLEALNPESAAAIKRVDGGVIRRPDGDVEIPIRRPDGDVELRGADEHFQVPPCERCGGILKPNVVFFGDGVPRDRAERAMQLAQTCDGLLVVGSSLQVYSAFRLAKAAKAAQAGLAIVGVGPTRADALADIKQASVVGEALSRLAGLPEMLLPRGA
eukprot:jgi/Astpho2/2079/e_gw1.00038.165.1_t